MRTFAPFFALLPVALAATPAAAQDLFPLRFEEACYARRYDPAHLAAHPRQLVSEIALLRSASAVRTDDGSSVFVRVTIRVRGDTGAQSETGRAIAGQMLTTDAECAGAGPETVECGIEDDGGFFLLDVAGGAPASLRLSPGRPDGFRVAGPGGWDGGDVWWVNPADDHEVFRLDRLSDDACRARLNGAAAPDPMPKR